MRGALADAWIVPWNERPVGVEVRLPTDKQMLPVNAVPLKTEKEREIDSGTAVDRHLFEIVPCVNARHSFSFLF